MSKFIKISNKKMIGFRGVAQTGKYSSHSPRLEMIKLVMASPGAPPIPWDPLEPPGGMAIKVSFYCVF